MNSYEIRFDLPHPREKIFSFVSDVRHLDLMTPPWLRFEVRRIVGAADDFSPRPGTTIDYRLRWRRLPLVWRSEITVWQPAEVFTYVARRGPYRRWIHEHVFEDREGGTTVIDRVWWSIHGGLWLDKIVRHEVREIFEFRAQFLRRMSDDMKSLSGSGRE